MTRFTSALFVIAMTTLSLTGISEAQTPEQRGLEVAVEADRRDTGWGDSSNELQMVLRNRHGEESTRRCGARTWKF